MKTREDALENVREAIRGYVAALKEDGIPAPMLQGIKLGKRRGENHEDIGCD